MKNGFGLSPSALFFAVGASIATASVSMPRASSVAASLGDRYSESSCSELSDVS